MSVFVPSHIRGQYYDVLNYIEYYIKNYDVSTNKYLYKSTHEWQIDLIMIYDRVSSKNEIKHSYYDIHYNNIGSKTYGDLHFNYQISFDKIKLAKRSYLLSKLKI